MIRRNLRWTVQDIKSSLPAEKNRADAYWTRWVLRPISYPVSLLFLRWGWSANGVSYLSAGLAILGGVLLSLPYLRFQVAGAILLNFFAVLDCADGNIARVTGTLGPWGAWADALGGYVAYVATLLGAGMAAELASVTLPSILFCIPEFVWPRGGWVFLGGMAASTNLLMRLTYQQYRTLRLESEGVGRGQVNHQNLRVNEPEEGEEGEGEAQTGIATDVPARNTAEAPAGVITDNTIVPTIPTPIVDATGGRTASSEISFEKRISENLGVTGLLMPAVLFGVLTKTIGCVVLFYTVLYSGGALVSILRLARKVERWKSSD